MTGSSHRTGRRRGSFVLIGLMAAQGCAIRGANELRSTKISRQDQAGSSHVSVLSVARWEDYETALQPSFGLKAADDALQQVLPITARFDDRTTDALAARVRLGLPRSSSTETKTTDVAADGTSSTVSNKTEKDEPGTVTDAAFGAIPDAAAALPATLPINGDIAIDPMRKYWAATALYQEVALLNRYVKDVAFRHGLTANVVRMQISLLPHRRGEPLDAYTTASFFPAQCENVSKAATWSASDRQYDFGPTPFNYGQRPNETLERSEPLLVVPILVTDNIETAFGLRSTEMLREYALGLSALTANVAASGDFEKRLEKLQSRLGRDANSLLTVARLTDGTLRIRLGAVQQGSTTYAMVPQNHIVTALILTPPCPSDDQARSVHVSTRTEFVDASNGRAVRTPSPGEVADLLDKALKRYHIDVSETDPVVGELLSSAADNNRQAFNLALAQLKPRGHNAFSGDGRQFFVNIWHDVTTILAAHPYAALRVELPRRRPAALAVPTTTAFMTDDGKETAVLELDGSVGFEGRELIAEVTVAGATGVTHTLASVGVRVRPDRRIVATFPSPEARGLCPKPAPPAGEPTESNPSAPKPTLTVVKAKATVASPAAAPAPSDPVASTAAAGPACTIKDLKFAEVRSRWEPASVQPLLLTHRGEIKYAIKAPPAEKTFAVAVPTRVVRTNERGDGQFTLTVSAGDAHKPVENPTCKSTGANIAIVAVSGADVRDVETVPAKAAVLCDGKVQIRTAGVLRITFAGASPTDLLGAAVTGDAPSQVFTLRVEPHGKVSPAPKTP